MNRRNAVYQLVAAQLGLLGLATAPARAQGYPDRPVRILVGVPAGAGPDVEARAFAAALQLELGQTVLVENKPGFTGLLAMDAVAKAASDGYTLGGCTPTNMTSNPQLFDRPLFNVEKDIVPISQFIEHPWLLYISAKLPARTLADFVALAKASPGRISYASASIGSFPHLTAEWFQKLAGIRLNHIPYGTTHWQTDLLSGTVDATFYPLVGLVDHVRGGKLRALGGCQRRPIIHAARRAHVHRSRLPGIQRPRLGRLGGTGRYAGTGDRTAGPGLRARGAAARVPRVRGQVRRGCRGQFPGGLCALHAHRARAASGADR